MAVTEPIRKKKELNKLADYWLKRNNPRNYALVVVGVYSMLRPSDLLSLTWDDVFDSDEGKFRRHISMVEKKTGKSKTIALNDKAVNALRLLMDSENRRDGYIFASNRCGGKAISRVQAWRIVKISIEATKVPGNIALYSLRKTLGYHAWKAGVSPVVLMDIYNHSSYDITRRYLGVSQDDRDEVYLKTALF